MSFATLLIGITIGLPFGLLMACAIAPLRKKMPGILPYAPIPAAFTAILSIDAPAFMFGNAKIPLAFSLDLASAILLISAATLWIACGFYARNMMRDRPDAGRFSVCWLMTLLGCLGVYLAADMVSFYAFLALLSIGATCLVMHEQTHQSRHAAMAYLGVALIAECFLLLAFVLLALITPGHSLWINDAANALASNTAWQNVILALLMIGLGAKAGLIPMHFFLPLAHGISMIPVAAVISGAAIKASFFGFIHFIPANIAFESWGMGLTILGLFGAIYGVLIGLTQEKPKVILAYSTVSQMGFIMAILGMGIMAADESARLAAAFYAGRHVLAKGGLFLAVGVVLACNARRYWYVLPPVLLLSLSFAGLPLTGGSLAKSVSKEVMGDGLAYAIATLSSIATTLLMLHFFRCLKANFSTSPNAAASQGQILPWIGLTIASFVIPVAIYFIPTDHQLANTLKLYALWSTLWPILVGVVIAFGVWLYKMPQIRVEPGDIGLALLNACSRPYPHLSRSATKFDDALKQWPIAAIALFSAVMVFGIVFIFSH